MIGAVVTGSFVMASRRRVSICWPGDDEEYGAHLSCASA